MTVIVDAPVTAPRAAERHAGKGRRSPAGQVGEEHTGQTREQHAGRVRELLAAMVRNPAGQTSASVYETARLVALAPWLPGHDARIAWLLERQRADGGWGGPQGYALVPSLSATDALLATLARGGSGPALVRAARRGLRFVAAYLGDLAAPELPDLPATDLIVPALVQSINGRRNGAAGLATWHDVPRLPLPSGMDLGRLDGVRGLLRAGRPVPEKLAHALEVGGELARRAAGVCVGAAGTVGASPAATAAWLGWPEAPDAVPEHLRRLAVGGPVPCTSPITVFERVWVLSILARAGVPMAVPAGLVGELRATVGASGVATGPGLPADADTTSVTLYALARLGLPLDPTCLGRYDTGGHFCTWQGEDGASVTTNAHVLDALDHHLAHAGPAAHAGVAAVADRVAAWLVARQEADGRWCDRWHASSYYATYCAVLALVDHAPGAPADAAVTRAVEWLLDTQRPDGSWGRWVGTAEETAYAVLALRGADRSGDPRIVTAVSRGRRRLSEWDDATDDGPALWHDKDLYRPTLIVRAVVLAALWVDPGVAVVNPCHDQDRLS